MIWFSFYVARFIRFGVVVLLLVHFGCATSSGLKQEQAVVISSSEYQNAFSAATEVLRAEGFTPALRDPRQGVIETEPRIAGSLFEPWYNHRTSFSQTVENTLALQREWIRVEFAPVDEKAGESEGNGEPDLLAVHRTIRDLTRTTGDLQLRVFVFLDRAHQPGLRRSPWTRTKTTRMLIYPHTEEGEATRPLPALTWTPLSRDPAAEGRLRELLGRRMGDV